MNYFAHGLPHVDQPLFLAGTALPDWLSIARRSVRLRCESLEDDIRSGGLDAQSHEIACGARQHLRDDERFHALPAFCEMIDVLATRFRAVLAGDRRRPSFLGHVALEMLLDAALIDRFPSRLDDYYESLARVCPKRVRSAAAQLAGTTVADLPEWIEGFVRLRFLEDYRTNDGLYSRLNQVVRRVKLSPLPAAAIGVLEEGRELVGRRLHDLYPVDLVPVANPDTPAARETAWG